MKRRSKKDAAYSKMQKWSMAEAASLRRYEKALVDSQKELVQMAHARRLATEAYLVFKAEVEKYDANNKETTT